MSQFANTFTPDEIRQRGVAQISWRSIIAIMSKCKTCEERLWYISVVEESSITATDGKNIRQNYILNVIRTNLYHDRFIVIDDELYNIGSSIKDIGKKISHISKLESINIDELLNKYI